MSIIVGVVGMDVGYVPEPTYDIRFKIHAYTVAKCIDTHLKYISTSQSERTVIVAEYGPCEHI